MLEAKPGKCRCKAQAIPGSMIEESSDVQSDDEASSDSGSLDFREEKVADFFHPKFEKYRAPRSVSLPSKAAEPGAT